MASMAVLRMQTWGPGLCLSDPGGSASQRSVCPAGKPQPREPPPPQLSPSLPPSLLTPPGQFQPQKALSGPPAFTLAAPPDFQLWTLNTPPLRAIPGCGALTHCMPGTLLAQPPTPAQVPPLPPKERGALVEWRHNGGGWGLCLGTAPFLPSTAPTSRTEGTGLKLREVTSFAKVPRPAGRQSCCLPPCPCWQMSAGLTLEHPWFTGQEARLSFFCAAKRSLASSPLWTRKLRGTEASPSRSSPAAFWKLPWAPALVLKLSQVWNLGSAQEQVVNLLCPVPVSYRHPDRTQHTARLLGASGPQVRRDPPRGVIAIDKPGCACSMPETKQAVPIGAHATEEL